MRGRYGVVATLLALVGCAALVGIEETTTLPAGGPDAAFDAPEPADGGSGGSDASVEDGEIVVPPNGDPDAALPPEDDGGTDGSTCVLGSRQAYVPSVSGVIVDVCNESAALTQGGNVAGLDCHGAGTHTISGRAVTACVGIEYSVGNLASAMIRIQRMEKGCLYTCYGGGCGQTLTASVFVGTGRSIDSWQYVGSATALTPGGTNYSFGPFPPGNWKVIGICRNGAGAENEDVGVDGVTAKCR